MKLAADLAEIPYAGSAIALVGYRRGQVARPLDGFGFVVPEIEHRPILAASFSSVKFAGRAVEDRVLFRVFLGGSGRPDLVQAPDDELRKIVTGELGELLGVAGEPGVRAAVPELVREMGGSGAPRSAPGAAVRPCR